MRRLLRAILYPFRPARLIRKHETVKGAVWDGHIWRMVPSQTAAVCEAAERGQYLSCVREWCEWDGPSWKCVRMDLATDILRRVKQNLIWDACDDEKKPAWYRGLRKTGAPCSLMWDEGARTDGWRTVTWAFWRGVALLKWLPPRLRGLRNRLVGC